MAEGTEIYTAITEDGSLSLVSGEHRELYHNRAGAFTEALKAYSEVAFKAWEVIYPLGLPPKISVLDCCFGLGYNSLVLAQQMPANIDLRVSAVELDPRVLALLPRVVAQSCFSALRTRGFGPPEAEKLSCLQPVHIKDGQGEGTFIFEIEQTCLRAYLTRPAQTEEKFDLIFHDPFSPKKMPELWTIDLFAQYKKRLHHGGFILTYSSAPAVRGGLLDLGFSVYRTPNLGGKSGGTLAILGNHLHDAVEKGELGAKILPLLEEENYRLQRSSRVPYRDPHLLGDRPNILALREQEQAAFNLPRRN